MSRLATLLILLLVSPAAVGCGAGQSSSGSFSGEDRKVADVFKTLSETAQKGDERRICRQVLSAAVARGLGDCTKVVNETIKNIDSFRLDVKSVKVTGSTATAKVQQSGHSDTARTVKLVREGGAWKLAELPAPSAGTATS